MSRNLPALIEAEVAKQQVYTFHLVEFQFDSGTLYFTTLNKAVVFNSNTYLASPDFVTFGTITESEKIELGSMFFTLSSVDLTVVAQALLEDFVDRPILLYRGFLDPSTYQVIVDPILLYEGRIKSFKLSENVASGTSTLTWNTASIWADFSRTSGRRTNDNDQQIFYPGDKSFEYAHQVTFDVKWGRT